MKAIRPRETRLFIDAARELYRSNPHVLKVKDRRVTRGGNEEMDLQIHKITNFDTEFATHFFYPNNTGREPAIQMIMVPFNLNGDE